MKYDAHESLVAPARPSAALSRLFTGIVLTTLLFYMFSYLYTTLHRSVAGPAAWEAFLPDLQSGTTPAGVLVNLYLFGLAILSLGLALRIVHGRGLRSLTGPAALAVLQFRRVCAALLALYVAVAFILPSEGAFEAEPHLAPGRWLALLPLALAGVLVQTSAEELAFRGYLQSQLAARFPHPAIWIGLPSAGFALLHHDPVLNGDNAWLVVVWAGLFGAAAADLTARAGTLGPAIAMHFVNNCSAILLSAPEGNFDGLALFTYPFSLADREAVCMWAPVDIMVLFCSWLAARLVLRR